MGQAGIEYVDHSKLGNPITEIFVRPQASTYAAEFSFEPQLSEVLVSAGYERSKSDSSLYVQKRLGAEALAEKDSDVLAACA